MRIIISAINAWLTSDRQQTNNKDSATSRADAKPLDFILHVG